MKKELLIVLKNFIYLIILTIIAYGISAFSTWKAYPGDWSDELRFTVGFILSIIAYILACNTTQQINDI